MLTNDTMIHVSFMLRLGYIYVTFINLGPQYLAYHLVFLWTSQPLVTALIGQLYMPEAAPLNNNKAAKLKQTSL